MSGLDSEQLDELEERIATLLKNSWNSGAGRPKELTLREAIIVSSGYARRNIIEDVWAEIFDTSISRCVHIPARPSRTSPASWRSTTRSIPPTITRFSQTSCLPWRY
jgi:hypothetical protein